MNLERVQQSCNLIIVSKDCSSVPVTPERFGRKKRSSCDIAEAAALSAVPGCAGSLCRVLNQNKTMCSADGRYCLEVHRIAEEIHRNNEPGAIFSLSLHTLDLFLKRKRVKVIGSRIDITEDRGRTKHDGRLHRGDKCHIRAEHCIPRFNPICHKDQLQRFRSVGTADAVLPADKCSETRFQFLHFAATDEMGIFQHAPYSGVDHRLKSTILSFQINKFHNKLQ